MPRTKTDTIYADIDFNVNGTTVLTVHDQRFSPLELLALETQADAISVNVRRQPINGHKLADSPQAYAE